MAKEGRGKEGMWRTEMKEREKERDPEEGDESRHGIKEVRRDVKWTSGV